MGKKLLVTDLDGTLLKENNEILKVDVSKLKEFKKNGNYIAIATGRAKEEVKFLFNDYGLEFDIIATLNGAEIIDHTGKVLSKRYINLDKINGILEDKLIGDEEIIFVTEERIFRNAEAFLREGKKQNILTMNICFKYKDYSSIDKILEGLKNKYGHEISIFRNKNYIDIAPLGCSKGEALKEFKERLGIDHEYTYSIGDSWNDVSMIREAKVGATFYNTEDNLIKEADKVVNNFTEFLDFIINI